MAQRRNQVLLAQKAFRQGGDTRMLKRELAAGNPYALAKLARRGLEYRGGDIVRGVA
jgi:hypothetical protein